MPRYLSLKRHYKKLRRKYRKITAFRYFYNRKSDLNPKRRFNAIRVFFLIHDEDRGYSILDFAFRRAEMFTIAEWRKRFTEKVSGYEPIMNVFTQSVLGAINNKSGAEWRFKTLIGWADDIPKTNTADSSITRNKPSKKKRAR